MNRNNLTERIRNSASIHNRIILSWGTGVGKSRAAIVVMNQMLETNPSARILLLVNETAHKKNWKEQFDVWNLKECDITIECYASMKNYVNTSWDMVVADEAHHLGSENRLLILNTIQATKFVCLSATLPKDIKEELETIYGNFFTDSVTLQESIDYGILPQPEIQVIGLTLNTLRETEEIIETWGPEAKRIRYQCHYADRFKFKNKNNFPASELHILCTQQQKYAYLSEQYEYWRKRYMMGKLQFAKNKWLHLGSDRKRFLGECKTKAAQEVINRVGANKRYLCFCTSIAQAEALGGSDAIHSKKSDSLRIVEEFNEMKRDKLFAINMLQEGMNLKNLDWGMIVQLDGCERGWIQKIGRMMRSTKPRIVILYYKNTKDEEYLKNVIEGIDNSYIKFYKI